MDRIIKILDNSHILSFIKWLEAKDGHLNPVFIAEFKHPDIGNVTAFCKLYNPQSKGLLNEIVGFLAGKAISINQPEHAFLAIFPKKSLMGLSKIASRPSNQWLKNNEEPYLHIFCTSRLDGPSAAIHFNCDKHPEMIQPLSDDISQWKQYSAAVALDEQIAHVDRHLNNLLRLGKKNYALIDNGRLVNPYDESWQVDMLEQEKLFQNKLYETVINCRQCSKPTNQDIHSHAILSAEQHSQLPPQIAHEMEFWLNNLLTEPEKQPFQDFLQYRTKEAPWLLKKRFRVSV